ncbi:MAG: GNAT family N-acetyltransferase [Candidatus Methanomethylicia archaeon]
MATEAILKDGKRVRLRVANKDDGDKLLKMYKSLSAESIYRRFLGFAKLFRTRDFNYIVNQVLSDEFICVIAEYNNDIVAEADLHIKNSNELGVVVRDDFQGRGLGEIILKYLLDVAGKHGIKSCIAYTFTSNTPAIHIAQKYGCKIKHLGGNELLIEYNSSS